MSQSPEKNPSTPSTGDSKVPLLGELYEVTEDLSGQKLWNKDIAPTSLKDRSWSMWNIAALWVGMSVCIPTYMIASSLVQGGMNWWQAVITVLLGNLVVLAPMILNAHAGTKYGVPFPVFARASFGLYGSNIPAMMRAQVACGWFGIQTWIGGFAVYQLHMIMTPGFVHWLDGFDSFLFIPFGTETWLGITFGQFVAFIGFWILNMIFVWIGTESIRWLETLAAPFLLLVGLGLLIWAYRAADGFGPILSQPSKFETFGEFFKFFLPGLTGMVGYWATLSLNISDFTRYAKSQKDQIVGQAIGLPPTMTLFAFIGVAVTSATLIVFGEAVWDPVDLLSRFDSPVLVGLSLFALTVATISTNIAANIVSPANDFSNLLPRYITFRIGGTIAGVIGILIMPWKLLNNPDIYIFTWLIGYSALLGPIAAILICDYYVIRGRRMEVEELYKSGGKFARFNPVALLALGLGILINVPGFLETITTGYGPGGAPLIDVPDFFTGIYQYAWFTGFVVTFALYWIFVKVMGDRSARAA